MVRLLLTAFVLFATSACAQLRADSSDDIDIDITTLTCADFLATDLFTRRFSSPERHSIALLLTGYLMAERKQATIAKGALLHMSDMLEDGCREGAFGDRPMLQAMLEEVTLQ